MVAGYADLLKQQVKDEVNGPMVGRLASEVTELAESVARLIDYAACADGAFRTESRPADLESWMRSLSSWLTTRSEECGVEAKTTVTEGTRDQVWMQGNLLRQLMQNLLWVAFADPNLETVELRLRVQPVIILPTGRVRLVFNVEARRKEGERGKEEGTVVRTTDQGAMSLANATRLVELMQGKLKVDDGDPAMWRATLVMTVFKVEGGATEKVNVVEQAFEVLKKQLQDATGQFVVVAADDETRALLVQGLNQAIEQECLGAKTSTELASLLDGEEVPVVVVSGDEGGDWMADIRSVIRDRRKRRAMPYLVVISADLTPEKVDRLLDEGADAYVPRPLNRAGLLVVLSDGLREYDRRCAARRSVRVKRD